MKRKLWFIALVVAVFGMIAGGSLVSAAKPAEFTASGYVAVTDMSEPVPAGKSGRLRIESEILNGVLVVTEPADSPLAGKALVLQQKSNELFAVDDPENPDLATAVAVQGNAAGSFDMLDGATVVASGRYNLKVTHLYDEGGNLACQIYGEGHWSSTGGGDLKGRGTVQSCLNFVYNPENPAASTFVGTITLSGTLN